MKIKTTIVFRDGRFLKVNESVNEITEMIDTMEDSDRGFLILSDSFGNVLVRVDEIMYVTSAP